MAEHHDPDALDRLAERCEAGESGSEMDRAIYCALGCNTSLAGVGLFRWPNGEVDVMPPLTTSIDACEALRKRLLPGWHMNINVQPSGIDVIVSHPDAFGEEFEPSGPDAPTLDFHVRAPTEPLARLAATLRAYAATVRENDHG
jgi:hypothetical protein